MKGPYFVVIHYRVIVQRIHVATISSYRAPWMVLVMFMKISGYGVDEGLLAGGQTWRMRICWGAMCIRNIEHFNLHKTNSINMASINTIDTILR